MLFRQTTAAFTSIPGAVLPVDEILTEACQLQRQGKWQDALGLLRATEQRYAEQRHCDPGTWSKVALALSRTELAMGHYSGIESRCYRILASLQNTERNTANELLRAQAKDLIAYSILEFAGSGGRTYQQRVGNAEEWFRKSTVIRVGLMTQGSVSHRSGLLGVGFLHQAEILCGLGRVKEAFQQFRSALDEIRDGVMHTELAEYELEAVTGVQLTSSLLGPKGSTVLNRAPSKHSAGAIGNLASNLMTESFSVKFQGDRYMTRSALAPGIAYLHLRDSEMASEYFGELVSGLNERLGANSAHPLIATARAYCLVAAISSIGNLDRKGSDGVRQAKPLLERLDRELEDNNIAYPHLAELAILRASLPLCAPGLFELEGPVGPQLIREVADDLEDVIECIAVECGTRHQLYGRAAYLQARLLTEITDDYNESLRLLKRFELAAEAYIEAFGGCHSTSQSIMSFLVVNYKQLNQPQKAGDWERRRYESLADDSHYQ